MSATLKLAGREVRRVGLGTNRLRNRPANVEFLRAAVEAGLQHIDTAYLYTGGESESAIGAAFSEAKPDGRVLPIAAVQNQDNLSTREHDPVIDHCEREGIVFVPYFPLRGGRSPRESLAWLLQRSPVILPIPGTLSLEHLRENLAVLDSI